MNVKSASIQESDETSETQSGAVAPENEEPHMATPEPETPDTENVQSEEIESAVSAQEEPATAASDGVDHGSTDVDAEVTGFAQLGLSSLLLETLGDLGYEEPTPIQAGAVPMILAGRDLLGQAATGTGKTAAFALPMIERIGDPGSEPAPSALVLVPTRELALQVTEAVQSYGKRVGARVLAVFGGQPIGRQQQVLRRGVDIVVATPGRAVDLIERNSLDLTHVRLLVLDEADEMLMMGFADELEAIVAATPEGRQTVLFSATMPRETRRLADRLLHDPAHVSIQADNALPATIPDIRHVVHVVARAHKAAALGRVLDAEAPTAALIFCRTRHEVDSVAAVLGARGYRAEALHGGLNQDQRERVIGRLRSGQVELVVATDVAARGLDIDVLSHVVNYDVPSAPEAYIHRAGRVGRGGRSGVAVTIAEPRERGQLRNIERLLGSPLPVATLPTSDELRTRHLDQREQRLREIIEAGTNELALPIVERLTETFDDRDVALAAVAMLQELDRGPTSVDEHIPDASLRQTRDRQGRPERGRRDDRPRGNDRFDRGDRGDRGDRDRGDRGERQQLGDTPGHGKARIFIGAGRDQRVGPGDLVGAIANETSVPGSQIGPMRVFERFSLVDVPEDAVDDVVDALRNTQIRGRSVNVRRDRGRPEGDRGRSDGGYRGRSDGGYRGRSDGDRGRSDGGYRGRSEGDRGRPDSGYRGRSEGGYRGRSDGPGAGPSRGGRPPGNRGPRPGGGGRDGRPGGGDSGR
jgi:ATP-dependent RNA helicase DeaD